MDQDGRRLMAESFDESTDFLIISKWPIPKGDFLRNLWYIINISWALCIRGDLTLPHATKVTPSLNFLSAGSLKTKHMIETKLSRLLAKAMISKEAAG